MKTFNLNSYVKVKLTEFGVKLLNETDYGKFLLTNYVENNIFKVKMWELMNIFGEYMYFGNTVDTEIPIETEIFIDEKSFEDSEDAIII